MTVCTVRTDRLTDCISLCILDMCDFVIVTIKSITCSKRQAWENAREQVVLILLPTGLKNDANFATQSESEVKQKQRKREHRIEHHTVIALHLNNIYTFALELLVSGWSRLALYHHCLTPSLRLISEP